MHIHHTALSVIYHAAYLEPPFAWSRRRLLLTHTVCIQNRYIFWSAHAIATVVFHCTSGPPTPTCGFVLARRTSHIPAQATPLPMVPRATTAAAACRPAVR
ncbi:hypothetical protein VTK73DRAFT_7803 [Phialemonium thermophilum]|uniref:Uncharacterized protein n=1 Tax=Phialemonium thermophilum TaxID=223376 RepID=A0ABR3WCV8_9PEZI